MRKILFALLVIIVGCHTTQTRTPASTGPTKYPELTFDKLYQIASKAETVEQALEWIAKEFPEYLRTHTYMYDSFSLQSATFENPRALVFGPKAEFVFSFNGDPKQKGGYAFETMEFDRAENKFLFREIAFKKQIPTADLKDVTGADLDTRLSNTLVRVTKSNPNRCTQCHGQDPHPIWETYFMWPGAYGSEDDILTSIFNRDEINNNPNYAAFGLDKKYLVSMGRQLNLKPGVKDVEVEGFRKFIPAKVDHPRFKHLPHRAIDQGFLQLAQGIAPEQIDISAQVQAERPEGSYAHARPNLNLMVLLYNLGSERLYKTLLNEPQLRNLPSQLYIFEKCTSKTYAISPRKWTPANLGDMDPLKNVGSAFSSAEVTQIRNRAGEWTPFFKSFLTAEFSMETEKVSRVQNIFGNDSLMTPYRKPKKKDLPRDDSRPSIDLLRQMSGNKYPSARYLLESESDDLLGEAQLAYLAKGFGVDLSQYVTNMRRAPTFRESGLREFFEKVESSAGFPPKSYSSIGEPEQKCQAIIKKLNSTRQ